MCSSWIAIAAWLSCLLLTKCFSCRFDSSHELDLNQESIPTLPFRVRYPGFQLQYWSLATLGRISSVLGTPSLLIDSAQKKQGSPLRSGCSTAFPREGIYY